MNPILLAVLRNLASLKLAVILILVLAAVLAAATVLESGQGRDYAQWYVYRSSWFIGLLALLGANILAATLVRFPWSKTRRGFLTTHAGLLLLLLGSIQTFHYGIEGQVSIQEGQTADTMLITDRCQFTTYWQGKDSQLPLAFIFHPGPVDWAPGKTLDLGELEGVQLKVLRYLRHSQIKEAWVADAKGKGKPAVQFALAGPDGKVVMENWLAPDQFGGAFSIGPAKFQIHQAKMASMLDDFLKPPGAEADPHGVLSLHYDGQMTRIAVSEHEGKKVAVGKSGIEVEIERYLANARPDEKTRFASDGDRPDNPMLELRVYLPDKKEPLRQIAFARYPLLSLDGIHGWNSPVKFWYHHQAVKPEPGVEFLQMPDGKLYGRVAASGKYAPKGEIKAGVTLETAAHFKVLVRKYLPHASKKVEFLPVPRPVEETAQADAAVLLEIVAGGAKQQQWFKRHDENYGFQQIVTPKGPLAIDFGYERFPLGFTLKLVDFRRGKNPGRMGDASFSSSVRLVDRHERIDRQHVISMNEPLVHGKFAFYQSSFQELPDGQEASVFTAAYDPGRFLKYLGSLMICAGSVLMFFSRTELCKRILRLPLLRRFGPAEEPRATDGDGPRPAFSHASKSPEGDTAAVS